MACGDTLGRGTGLSHREAGGRDQAEGTRAQCEGEQMLAEGQVGRTTLVGSLDLTLQTSRSP